MFQYFPELINICNNSNSLFFLPSRSRNKTIDTSMGCINLKLLYYWPKFASIWFLKKTNNKKQPLCNNKSTTFDTHVFIISATFMAALCVSSLTRNILGKINCAKVPDSKLEKIKQMYYWFLVTGSPDGGHTYSKIWTLALLAVSFNPHTIVPPPPLEVNMITTIKKSLTLRVEKGNMTPKQFLVPSF